MIVSVFVCPVWAGEDLHKLVALNLEKLAFFLEGALLFFFYDQLAFLIRVLFFETSIENLIKWKTCRIWR